MPKKKNNEVLPLDINEFKLVPHGEAPRRKAVVVIAITSTALNPSSVNTPLQGVPEDFSARPMVVTMTPNTARYPVAPLGNYGWDDTATYYKEV